MGVFLLPIIERARGPPIPPFAGVTPQQTNRRNIMDKQLVEIMYKLADGKRIRLEVSIEVKDLLEQADRQIRSQQRQDRRRHTEYVDGLTDTTTVLP